ncbi:40S ribosomal protein s19-3 [Phtheirospermum japonicum]|uniref:40S ribosomal protein s19-3 n=1 Tax=Phtheirospermum japonicum TaxID=374723 RepID=A0A830BA71_9LAMI|nr:40S ribosomal protein s19-3 [Phtheirospermum japonicum]
MFREAGDQMKSCVDPLLELRDKANKCLCATRISQRGGTVSCLDLITSVMATAKTVKDVSPNEFVKSYASHLKRFGKIELPE